MANDSCSGVLPDFPMLFSICASTLLSAITVSGTPLPLALSKDLSCPLSLHEAKKLAPTPAEKVAVTDAWLKSHPPTFRSRSAKVGNSPIHSDQLRSRLALSRPSDAKADLALEVRRALRETRAQAHNSRETVALTDEFLRLNSAALQELVPSRLALIEKVTQTKASPAGQPGSLRKDIAVTLRETRAEARNPAETVALTNEFLRLNASALAEAEATDSKSKSKSQ